MYRLLNMHKEFEFERKRERAKEKRMIYNLDRRFIKNYFAFINIHILHEYDRFV